MMSEPEIHPTAHIDPGVTLGAGCRIGAFCEIGAHVTLGANSVVQGHCSVGVQAGPSGPAPLFIGEGATIRSHSVIYAGSTIGSGLSTGHHVTVREGSKIGDGVQFGTQTDVQGQLRVGDHVKVHSAVFIAQNADIGDYAWLFPRVVFTDDPHPPSEVRHGITIEPFAAVGANVTLLPGVTVGRGALIAAGSTLTRDAGADEIWKGNPARCAGPTSRIQHAETGHPAYPWRRHFHRGYPDAVVRQWLSEFPHG